MAHLSPAQLIDYDNAERRRHPAIYREVPSSPQLGQEGPGRTDRIFLDQLRSAAKGSRYVELELKFNALRDQLASLRSVQAGWDTYGAPAPNEYALSATETALDTLRSMNVEPSGVLPSADGGIGICFMRNDQYAHIEFENSGDTWVLSYGPDSPSVSWQFPSCNTDSIREAWVRISDSLQS
jgi:hypothetical protein